MGDHKVSSATDGAARRTFTRALLDDLRALERLIEDGAIEKGVRRIGAEQELFIVDKSARPARGALQILKTADDPHLTTELGQFNLEINIDPLVFRGASLSRLESELTRLIDKAQKAAAQHDMDIVLAGILPTLRKADLSLENMTPHPRYKALNDALCALRGDAYEMHIKGLDELFVQHDSVMFEACNASFQIHYQCDADEFASLYNISQAVTGPVLAAAANSPMLFGRRLWRETRIALFQQAVDTRGAVGFLRERSPRVTFGKDWVRDSVLEIFQEDISRFRTVITADVDEASTAALARGEIPRLRALCLHNSSVYRWNRPCYGVTDGAPHLRIENRALPAGPTPVDEVANAAFWFGLISALARRHTNFSQVMSFDDAKMNFHSAARAGLNAHFTWLHGESLPAVQLICDKLLPLAHDGLTQQQICSEDADKYLQIIERRVAAGRTGSEWALTSYACMRGKANDSDRLRALTHAMIENQRTGKPVADWPDVDLSPAQNADIRREWRRKSALVDQIMSNDLFTVGEDETLDLVINMMAWRKIRHIPVEDSRHRLVGLISYRALFDMMARGDLSAGAQHSVTEVMKRDLIVAAPDTTILEAIDLMRKHRVGCLPVVSGEQLIGIVSERDLMNFAAELLEEQLAQ